jgi:3-deoxy-manno-octulosonate cytidylyltransferase (CMP-KDO synthetase)
MNEIAIIIPSRLNAERLPNKPLKLINNREMILHVYNAAKKVNMGEVLVATPDKKVFDIVNNHNGKAFLTKNEHQTGTDRVYEVFKNELKGTPKIIINLQGDMPNIDSLAIKNLIDHMKKNSCDIGTLASDLNVEKEEKDPNVVKLISKNNLKEVNFSTALDFFRLSSKPVMRNTYHHVGIYGFTNKALIRYVSLKRSKLEIERKLEQLRALENNIKIDFSCIKACPLSVDTEEDLIKIRKIMKTKK